MPDFVTVTRKWNNPEIFSTVNAESISLSMKIEDFKEAVKMELGSVAFVFTKDTLSKKIDDAFQRVLQGIKEESSKVVA